MNIKLLVVYGHNERISKICLMYSKFKYKILSLFLLRKVKGPLSKPDFSCATIYLNHYPQKCEKYYKNPGALNVLSTMPYVITIRSKQEWSFYLETNATIEWFQFVKRGKGTSTQGDDNSPWENNVSAKQPGLSDVCTVGCRNSRRKWLSPGESDNASCPCHIILLTNILTCMTIAKNLLHGRGG